MIGYNTWGRPAVGPGDQSHIHGLTNDQMCKIHDNNIPCGPTQGGRAVRRHALIVRCGIERGWTQIEPTIRDQIYMFAPTILEES